MKAPGRIWLATGLLAFALCVSAQSVEDHAAAVCEPGSFGPGALKLEHLPYLKRAKMFQWSSFSHPSANDDDFYYPDPHAEGFKVFIDIKSPGSLNQWWSTGGMSKDVRLRFYFDGEDTPRLATTIGEWCGRHAPLGKSNWPGINFVPIPFRKRCVVSTDGPTGEEFHHMYAYTYPTPDGISTYTGREDYSAIKKMWNNVGQDPKSASGNRTVSGRVAIPRGRKVAIYDRTGQETIAALTIDPAPAEKALLVNLWIKAYWDGSAAPQVDAPLSYFFGGADHGESAVSRALPVGIRTDGPWYFYYPMPYWSSARIEIENKSQLDCTDFRYEIQYKPKSVVDYPKERCGYFCAHFAAAEATGPANFMVLEAEGAGHVVGVVKGPGRLGENDEMIYIDDNLTPQSWGTGGEDYPLFCYGMRTESYPLWGGWKDWRYYRYHVADTINFHRNIRFGFEHGERHKQGWLKPNKDTMHIESLCLYYRNPVPNLVLTDELDVGNSASETRHGYTVKGQTWSGVSKHAYQGEETVSIQDDGRHFNGHSEFTVKVHPENDGVRLRRRMRQTHIQEAKVYVNGEEVVESRFYSPIHYKPGNGFYDTNQLWRDLEFEIPARCTRNKNTLSVRIEHVPPSSARGGDWTEYYYWVYSYTRRQPAAPDRQK